MSGTDSEHASADTGKVSKLSKLINWFIKYDKHIYGAAGVVALVIAIGTTLAPQAGVAEPSTVDSYTEGRVKTEVLLAQQSDPVVITEPSPARVDVETVPELSSEGFRVIQQTIINDFRNYEVLNSVDLGSPKSAVTQFTTHTVRKEKDVDKFLLGATTSGFDVYVYSPTHAVELIVYASEERSKFGNYVVKPRVYEFDVSDIAVGAQFTIQHNKTYWNAFQGIDQSWTGFTARMSTDNIEILTIFPEDRSYTDFEFYANNSNGDRVKLENEPFVLEDSEKSWIWWRAVNPDTGLSYNIDWEW